METNQLSSNFWIRTASSIAIFVVVVGLIMASPYTMLMLLTLICICSMLEFYKIAKLTGAKPLDVYPAVLGAATVLIAFFVKVKQMPSWIFLILVPLIFILFITELHRKSKTPFANIAWSLLGLVYIAVPLAMLAFIPVQGTTSGYVVYRPLMILGIFFIVWANDVGAYLFGVTLGRHKLFPRVSPKKSWEGFFGGLLCAVAVGALMSHLQSAPIYLWAVGGAVISIFGVYGDLVESMFKRSVDIKDSGSIIPGHGGFLDRFDALFLAAPFIFIYFIIFT